MVQYFYFLVFCESICQRKLRRQASDNMDRWRSRGGKSQRRERTRKKIREETRRREKIREEKEAEESRSRCAKTVEQLCNTVFFSDVSGVRRVEKYRLAEAAAAEPSAGRAKHLGVVGICWDTRQSFCKCTKSMRKGSTTTTYHLHFVGLYGQGPLQVIFMAFE